jgi:hypothetical protein
LETNTRRYRTRDEWARIMEEQTESGLSQKAFCEQRGIAVGAFYNAKKRMRTKAMTPAVEAAFLGVTVEDVPLVPRWDVELSLGDGVVLRLRRSAAEV